MAQKTYAQLAAQTTLVDADLLAAYRSSGPLKKITAALVVSSYLDTFYVRQDGTKPFTAVAPVFLAGAESTPGLAFAAEPSTGLWRPSSGVVALSTGGVQRAQWSSAGMILSVDLAVTEGGTGASDVTGAQTNLGVLPGTDVFKQRTITGTANEITVSNGDGVSANPTLSLPAALTFTGKTVTGGTFNSAFNGTLGATTPAAATVTNLTVNGNTILGDAVGDTVVVNAGSTTRPNMTAFSVYLSADTTNETGDGTAYNIPFNSESYDRGGDFAAGVFTARYTGIHHLNLRVTLANVVAGNNQFSAFLTMSAHDDPYVFTGDLAPDVQGFVGIALNIDVLLTAGETVTPGVAVGGGTKTVGVKANIGAGTVSTWFTGHFVG